MSYDEVTPCPEWMNMKRAANWRDGEENYKKNYAKIKWKTREEWDASHEEDNKRKEEAKRKEAERKKKFAFNFLTKDDDTYYSEESGELFKTLQSQRVSLQSDATDPVEGSWYGRRKRDKEAYNK